MQSFIGRVLFALIFLSSAANKVRTFGSDGGPTLAYAAPKLDAFKAQVAGWTGISLQALPVEVRCARAARRLRAMVAPLDEVS